MRTDGLAKHVIIAFGMAVVFYIICFSWIQHERTAQGPWEIVFATDARGVPSLQISQATLRVTQTLTFPDRRAAGTNVHQTVRFADPIAEIPFGKMVFQDPTFLPGTVTMNLFDHEVELLPRVLIIDKAEHVWGATNEIVIKGTGINHER